MAITASISSTFDRTNMTYDYNGEVELRHVNTFVGFESFVFPDAHSGRVTHYILPLVDYYDYSTNYKGSVDPRASSVDKTQYKVFDAMTNTVVILVVLIIMWVVIVNIPKWFAAHYNKKAVFGLRGGLFGLVALEFILYILAWRYTILYVLGALFIVLSSLLSYYIYGRSKIAKDLEPKQKPDPRAAAPQAQPNYAYAQGPQAQPNYAYAQAPQAQPNYAYAQGPQAQPNYAYAQAPQAQPNYAYAQGPQAPPGPPVAPGLPPTPEQTTIIDDLFLIYRDGRLIAHHTRKLTPEMDDDILSGMLTAVQEFIKTSFGGDDQTPVDEISYGNNKILIEHGRYIFMSAVIEGQGSVQLHERMKIAVHNIELESEAMLKEWSGDARDLKDAKKWLKAVIGGEPIGKLVGPQDIAPKMN
jgi:hypothetical protein